MPSQLHDVFIARVVEEIQTRLHAFTDIQTQSGAFVRKVKHNGSGRLDLSSGENGETTIRRQPDASFKHSDAHWPGVILEVSYTQKTKAMSYLADDYILETNGSIRVVVGLDIDYKTKRGAVSIWRPAYVTNQQGELELEAAQVLYDQVFRDERGNPNTTVGMGLQLNLRDFAPQDLAGNITGSFLIDSATLCRFLNEAEQEEYEAKAKRGVVQRLELGAKKRRREKTPPEIINSDDDRTHRDDERRVRARRSIDDSSYTSSSDPAEEDS